MTKLEQVARAIDPKAWEVTPDYKAIKKSLDQARAALEAMRGPTKKMLAASRWQDDTSAEIFNAMIQAAIDEKESK